MSYQAESQSTINEVLLLIAVLQRIPKKPKSRSKPSRYSSENDVLIEKSVKYTDFFLLSIVYV